MHKAYITGYEITSDEPEFARMSPEAFAEIARALACAEGNTIELDAQEDNPAT